MVDGVNLIYMIKKKFNSSVNTIAIAMTKVIQSYSNHYLPIFSGSPLVLLVSLQNCILYSLPAICGLWRFTLKENSKLVIDYCCANT